jgi:hypothetical protein
MKTAKLSNRSPQRHTRRAEEFDGLISYIVHDSFDQVQETLQRIEQDVTRVLKGNDYSGEFERQAPPQLRELVENTVKMLHVMGLQLDAAGEAIREAATAHTGRRIERPGGPESRGFFQESEDDCD